VPRLLAVGHVTFDRRDQGEVLGGSVSYAALAARALGWEAGVLTVAGHDFVPKQHLPGVEVFRHPGRSTTRFANAYDEAGLRTQVLLSRADTIELDPLDEDWRDPDALLLAPVAGEMPAQMALAFEADVVGAIAQGWVRSFRPDGTVERAPWSDPASALAGVHVVFVSEHDLEDGADPAALLACVPMVVVTRGWRGSSLLSRAGVQEVPSLPRTEVDATGAGDVFAAAFLVRYHESGDPLDAAAFASCAAGCAVEGVGTTTLGDRPTIEARLLDRDRFLEDGDWE
jgi:1D-myo-inositol 3-kinase